jgi:aminoglycoside phosphotransferase (APT) family kinase protein
MNREPGPLLASGRDCDIFEYGEKLVLRRSRAGRSMAAEARTMEYVRQHGYPVPAVDEISDDGTDLVIERVNGLSMVDAISRRPWTIRKQGAVLADLHRRLHTIPAPEWFPAAPVGAGDDLVHLDLHPLNVMIGDRGPVVIDWTNAARGDGNVDVALAWVLMVCGGVPMSGVKARLVNRARGQLVSSFLRGSDQNGAAHVMAEVVAWKVTDAHMTDIEQESMWELARTEGR